MSEMRWSNPSTRSEPAVHPSQSLYVSWYIIPPLHVTGDSGGRLAGRVCRDLKEGLNEPAAVIPRR